MRQRDNELWSTPDLKPFPELRLMCELLAGTPRLGTDRACLNVSPDLFDAATIEDARAAQAICQQCPALAACRDWVMQASNRGRLEGVVAGHLRGNARIRLQAELGRSALEVTT